MRPTLMKIGIGVKIEYRDNILRFGASSFVISEATAKTNLGIL